MLFTFFQISGAITNIVLDYKIKNVMNNYGDTEKQAKNNILNSNKSRLNYYSVIAGGDRNNYDLCMDDKIENENAVKIICA